MSAKPISLDKPPEIDHTYGVMRFGLTTAEAAKAIGINLRTLQHWIQGRRVKVPKPILRNGRGVRLWSKADIERLREVKERTYRKGRGRKKKKA